MKISSLVRPILFLGIIIVIIGFCCSSTIIWGQYANSLPVSDDYTGFIGSMLCIPIPILILGGALIIFSKILRKPKYVNKCLRHSWEGCRCSLCGLEDHNWNGCICVKCNEKRYQDDRNLHDLSNCVCRKCGTAFHEASWAYKTANSCEQELSCSRCNQVLEQRVLHQLKWELGTTNACTKLQRCTRCSTILKERTDHKFKDANELRKSPCHFVMKCQHCDETQERYEHQFEYVKRLSESNTKDTCSWTDLQRCKLCGAENIVSDWNYTDW